MELRHMAELKKEITLLSGIGLLSTTLLGTGLFMIPAISASIAQEHALWAWLFLFIAIVPVALTFAQLGKHYPSAGGTAHFVSLAFNEHIARSVGWLFISVIPVGVPAAIALAASFAQPWLPEPFNTPLLSQWFTIFLLIGVNLLGSKSSAQIQTIIALGIIALVIAFLISGDVGSEDISLPSLTVPAMGSIGSALGVMFWCFVGIEAFAHMGEEFKNPKRDFPLAIVIGCLLAGSIYWASSVVILKFHAFGTPELDVGSIVWLSNLLMGSKWATLISILGFLACFASINLYTQSLSRMIWMQVKQTSPQSKLASLSRGGVPLHATLLVGIILLASATIGDWFGLDLELFVKLANGVFVLVYLLAMLAAFHLLSGFSKGLAAFSLILCSMVFLCLGWSMVYALLVFAILNLFAVRKARINA
jgi:amino acid efflux transporter